jgi:1,4-dihydroxy-2-naphthoyl-CoA hydrolase
LTREDLGGIEGPFRQHIDDAVANQDAIFRNTFPGALGVKILTAAPGSATGELVVDHRVLHPGGHAHGGAIAGFGDTLAAWATFPALAEGEVFSTIEFKTNFLRAISSGTLWGEANAVHRGGRTHVIDVKIYTGPDRAKLVAVMMVTQAVLAAKPAERASDY